jgi:uncharacterized protein YndB with AHSA1/START domain
MSEVLETPRSVDHAQFTIERTINASPARVFRAFEDAEARTRWFFDGAHPSPVKQDFRVGGQERSLFDIADGPGAGSYTNETTWLDIVPEQRIAFGYTMARDGVRFSASLGTIMLTPTGKGTKLVMTEQGAFFEGADGPAMRKDGWTELLDALKREVERA